MKMHKQDERLLVRSYPGRQLYEHLQDLSATSFFPSKKQVLTWRKYKAHLQAVPLWAVPGGDAPKPEGKMDCFRTKH